MEKIKQHKEIVIAVAVILAFIFYWIQIRPVTAKKECSWFTEIIPADVGVTKEQAEANKKDFDEQCHVTGLQSVKCFLLQKETVERPSQLEKEVTREATKGEYDKCLRHNGL